MGPMILQDWDPGITMVRSSISEANNGETDRIGRLLWRLVSQLDGFDLGACGGSDELWRLWILISLIVILAIIKAKSQNGEGKIVFMGHDHQDCVRSKNGGLGSIFTPFQ